MPGIFDFLLSGTSDAMRGDLSRYGAVAERQAASAANSAANRGGANPAAIASAASQATAAQRAQNATAQAGAMQQARMADQAQGNRIIGGLLGAGGAALQFIPGAQAVAPVVQGVGSAVQQAPGGGQPPSWASSMQPQAQPQGANFDAWRSRPATTPNTFGGQQVAPPDTAPQDPNELAWLMRMGGGMAG